MQLSYRQLKRGAPTLKAAFSAKRSASNILSRDARRKAIEDEAFERKARQRRKRQDDRDLKALLGGRVRVRVAEKQQAGFAARYKPRTTGDATSGGKAAATDARGPDGLHSFYMEFTPRGLKSVSGRRWRAGEAARAGLYYVRVDALEGGELGWWSNFADTRSEITGFLRTLESVEIHDRENANVYLTETIPLPVELTARQRRAAVRRICRTLQKRRLPYLAAIHKADPGGDQRNVHLHLLYSLRPFERHGPFDWSFDLKKVENINTPAGIAERRRSVIRALNASLHAAHVDKRYAVRSRAERGLGPGQPKIGQDATWAARRMETLSEREASLVSLQSAAGRLRVAATDVIETGTRIASLKTSLVVAQHRQRHAMAQAAVAGIQQRVAGLSANAAAHADRLRLVGMYHRLGKAVPPVRQRLGALRSDVALAVAKHADRLEATRNCVRDIGRQSARIVQKANQIAHIRQGGERFTSLQVRSTRTGFASLRDRLEKAKAAARLAPLPVSDHQVERALMLLGDTAWPPLLRVDGIVQIAPRGAGHLSVVRDLQAELRIQTALDAEWQHCLDQASRRLAAPDGFVRTPDGRDVPNMDAIGADVAGFIARNREDPAVIDMLAEARRAAHLARAEAHSVKEAEKKRADALRRAVTDMVARICGPAKEGTASEADRARIRDDMLSLRDGLADGRITVRMLGKTPVVASNLWGPLKRTDRLAADHIGWSALVAIARATEGLLPAEPGEYQRSYSNPGRPAGSVEQTVSIERGGQEQGR